jgi:hypothetical protein
MSELAGIERAKVQNGVCPECNHKMLSGGWNEMFLSGYKELFCERCNLKFSISEAIFLGTSVSKYKL